MGCEIVVVGCGRVLLIPGLLLFFLFFLLPIFFTAIPFVLPILNPSICLHSKPVCLIIFLVVVLYFYLSDLRHNSRVTCYCLVCMSALRCVEMRCTALKYPCLMPAGGFVFQPAHICNAFKSGLMPAGGFVSLLVFTFA